MWKKELVLEHDLAPKVIADSVSKWISNGDCDCVMVVKDDSGVLILANVASESPTIGAKDG